MNKKNILVGQSGGPTAVVINASLYGVICRRRTPSSDAGRLRLRYDTMASRASLARRL